MSDPRPNAIRSARRDREKPLFQRDLADLVGVTQTDISAYELGKVIPDLPRAFDIAHALGKRVEEIFWYLRDESLTRVVERREKKEKSNRQRGRASIP